MARPGVDYLFVAQVAQSLLDEGITPTIERVRMRLGTGSNSTIARYLLQFKEQNPIDTANATLLDGLPTHLLSLVKDLWNNLLQKSDEKIEAQATQHNAVLVLYQEEFNKIREDHDQLRNLYNSELDKNKDLMEKGKNTEYRLFDCQKELDNLSVKNNVNTMQLAEKQKRIEELHLLHNQTQANLEHFRDNMREQTIALEQKYYQEKNIIEQESNNQKKTIANLESRTNNLIIRINELESISRYQTQEIEAKTQQLINSQNAFNDQNNQLEKFKTNEITLVTHLQNKIEEVINLHATIKTLTDEIKDLFSQNTLLKIQLTYRDEVTS